MYKIFYWVIATLAVLLVASACDENNVGSSVAGSESTIVIDSSFVVVSSSYVNDKIPCKTVTQLLGSIQADDYGVLKSDFVSEFMPASMIGTEGVTVADIDSVCLYMRIPIGSYTGDSIVPMKVNVYALKKNLPYPITSDFDPTDYKGELWASKAYSMTTLERDSALYWSYDENYNQKYYQAIIMRLPDKFGKDLFTMYMENPGIFSVPSEFAKEVPGIYATTSYGNGRVMRITSTSVNLYYSKHTKTAEGNDTIIPYVGSYLGVTPEVTRSNNITYTPSAKLKAMVDAGETIIAAPAGYAAKVTFPAQDIIKKFHAHSDESMTVLNTVTMKIPAVEIANRQGIKPPKNLLLIKASEVDEFFADNKVPDNVYSFYSSYDSTTQSYNFTDLRGYLKAILNGEITEGFDDFLIIPVDMETESTSDYYSYYYGSSSTSVTKVVPQVSLPSMVKLDIANAKIYVTYSKKDYK